MRKISLALLLTVLTIPCFSQEENSDDEKKGKFRRDNIFLGGSIGLSIGGWQSGFSIGANPEIGYTVAEWLDAGIAINYNYFSYKAEYNNGVRQRSTTYGGGIFTRVYPVRNFFIQLQPEYNEIVTKLRYIYSTPPTDWKENMRAPSLLAGIGYGQRVIGGSSFFTVLMFDLGSNLSSPYISYDGSKLPILRTGFNFYLRPKNQR